MAATVRWAGWGGLAGESADGHGGVADGCDFLPVVTIHDVVKAIEDLVEFGVEAVGGKGGDDIGEALEIGEENREVVVSAGFSVAVRLEFVGDVAGENVAEESGAAVSFGKEFAGAERHDGFEFGVAGGDHALFLMPEGGGLAGDRRVVLRGEERQRGYRAKSGVDGDEDRSRDFGREAERAQRAADREEGEDGHARAEEAGAGAAVAPGEANLAVGDHEGGDREREGPTGTRPGASATHAPSATGATMRQNHGRATATAWWGVRSQARMEPAIASGKVRDAQAENGSRMAGKLARARRPKPATNRPQERGSRRRRADANGARCRGARARVASPNTHGCD